LMENLLSSLDRYEVIFYAVIGFAMLIIARKLFLTWKDWSIALFGLEKEYAQRKINQQITALIFCGLLGVGLFLVTTFLSPAVPGVQQLATPTVDLTSQPTLEIVTPEVTQSTQGLIPTLSAFLDKGCIPGQIEWTDPRDGGTISGRVELKGTVNVSNLGFYKFEYAAIDSNVWKTIAGGHDTIIDSTLGGIWDTRSLTPGEYQLRLIVSDNQNNPLPECKIKILINASL
jgi:hypothetical protein